MRTSGPDRRAKAPEDRPLNVGAVLTLCGVVILGLFAFGWGFRGLMWLFGWDMQLTIGLGLLAVGLLIVSIRVAQGVPLSWLLREDLRPENRRRPAPDASAGRDIRPR